MNLTNVDDFQLNDLAAVNVLLGKNGCGKSYLLKRIEAKLRGREGYGVIRYISPERGGQLLYEPGIEQNIASNPQWISDSRRQNQTGNFRNQSATLFRRLEFLILREIEIQHQLPGYTPRTFETTVNKLNTLLDRVRIERHDSKAFTILDKTTNAEVSPEQISSGEAELISLGIEILFFIREAVPETTNLLLIDEPDVHLHPDLQDRLARFLVSELAGKPITLLLATHSTALLAGLSTSAGCRVAFMRRGDTSFVFKPVTDVDRTILPIFGAHPLSNVFNQSAVLLVEGDDDERIWQQAVRSSDGKVRLYPCAVDSVDNLIEYEREVNKLITAVYDNARAFSLRDRDTHPEAIQDEGVVRRMRLSCRAAENLLLSDQVLSSIGMSWNDMAGKISQWTEQNADHQYAQSMQAFVNGGLDRKNADLKSIRFILLGMMSNKPWEVLVGKAIADLAKNPHPSAPHSLRDYLGQAVCQNLLAL